MLPKTTSHSKVVFNANSRWDLQALASSIERLMKSIFYGTTKARSSPSRIINLLQEVLLHKPIVEGSAIASAINSVVPTTFIHSFPIITMLALVTMKEW